MLKSLNEIFKADEYVGFKDKVEEYTPYKLQPSALSIPTFYCINPIKSYSDLKYENIKEFRNILVEFDSARLSTQERWVKESGMPYSLKTFSGNKSFHYIIALNKGIELQEYKQLAAIILQYIFRGRADESCKNPNRLSRTPGAIRKDTGVEQKLIEQLPAISIDQLQEWVYETNKNAWLSYKVAKASEEETRQNITSYIEVNGTHDTAKLIGMFFPEWEQVLGNTKVAAGRRHSVAVNCAIKMHQCGMGSDIIKEKLTTFLENNGKRGAWAEAQQIIGWVTKRIAQYDFDQDISENT